MAKLKVKKEKKIGVTVSMKPSDKKRILKKYASITDFVIIKIMEEFDNE